MERDGKMWAMYRATTKTSPHLQDVGARRDVQASRMPIPAPHELGR
jgi:hypothetical protein